MKIGKIYYCPDDAEWVQATSEYSVNSVCLIEGVTVGFEMGIDYYKDKIFKASKKDKKWFLECIIAGELVEQKEYKSKKDKLIEELVEQNYMLVLCLEDLCPGFKETHLTEVTKEI